MSANAYPTNWDDIARDIKARAGWRCEHCDTAHCVETWHVLTVHHLNGDKADCRWENLVALCQRCHLSIQATYTPGQQWLFGRPSWAEARGL